MRANWRPIPDDVRGDSRRLTRELRAIKDRSGLSLTQIGARTHYSKASWERWFNGKRLITEHALESLAITVDENARLLKPLLERALREVESGDASGVSGASGAAAADAASVPPQAPVPAVESVPAKVPDSEVPASPEPLPLTVVVREPAPQQPTGWRRHLRTALVSVCSAVIGAAVGAYVATPGGGSDNRAVGSPAHGAASPYAAPCAGLGCAGKDPQSTGCVKDERTLITDHVGTIIIYLHYSARCHAAWGGLTNAEPGDFATIITTSGDQEKALVHWGYDNYSMMVDAGDPSIGLKVCGVPQANPRDSVCTPELSAPTS